MAVVNKFNVNRKQVTLDADIIENMSANDVSYNDSFQYNENTVGDKLTELDQEINSIKLEIGVQKLEYDGEETPTDTYIVGTSQIEGYIVNDKFNIRIDTLSGSGLRLILYLKDGSLSYRNLNLGDNVYNITGLYNGFSLYHKASSGSLNVTGKIILENNLGQEVENIGQEVENIGQEVESIKELIPKDTTLQNILVAENEICDIVESWENIPLTMHLEDNTNGYYNVTGEYNFSKDDGRRSSEKISVTKGEKFKLTTHIRSLIIAAVCFWEELDGKEQKLSYLYLGTGTLQELVDVEITVPNGATSMAVCSTDETEPTLKKMTTNKISKFYTKIESDAKYAPKSEFKAKSYGVKWNVSDYNDEGERCFDAVGLTASIGIGNIDGNSDFDNIYPWSDIKRCNIKQNTNGANIVTFEGETGFALDGSNGDVFVRIPKFRYDKFVRNGYEYRVISDNAPYIHPVFIEEGKELNEIFISAFEGVIDSNSKLRSISGVIPTNNEIGGVFLTAARANGNNYSLYDMRCVDMLWTLMAVEFGKRNSNRIIGWGIADFNQPIKHSQFNVTVDGIGVNSVTIGKPTDEPERRKHLIRFSPGQTICICDGTQYNIVAERVITAFSCASINDNMVITFGGTPIDVTTTMFVGNAPSVTNFCETISDGEKLNWHTGRANKSNSGYMDDNTINPCRYRWIENPIGNVWHFLPDVSFDNLQMYICDNMKDYDMCKITSPYRPVANLLPQNSDNGNKADVTDANYWITQLLNDTFAKAIPFGKSYDKSLTSTKAFGGYYYLYNTNVCVVNGGGFDHQWRCNILTNRAWATSSTKWYLYGARLMFKNLDMI